ncbi:MAG: TetR/AcrR family transcriptional regulator [Spirochaetaceae bacterium]|nr:TetR/AcrR family transcriptional regulator [Spirochaetaceae bacterium]
MADKKDLIFKSAFQLFTTRGFHNTPTSLIAKNAGVANGTLFNHFKTKEALINQLYLFCKYSFNLAIEQGIDKQKGFKEQTHAIWHNVLSWAVENPEQQAFFQQYRHSPYINKETREEARQQFTPFLTFLHDGIENGVFKDVSIELMMGALLGIINSTVEVCLNDQEKIHDKLFLDQAFHILWDCVSV